VQVTWPHYKGGVSIMQAAPAAAVILVKRPSIGFFKTSMMHPQRRRRAFCVLSSQVHERCSEQQYTMLMFPHLQVI
jgi:hypothetical protein